MILIITNLLYKYLPARRQAGKNFPACQSQLTESNGILNSYYLEDQSGKINSCWQLASR